MQIIDFIATHWVQWLFALVSGALALAYRQIATRLKEEQKRNEAVAQGVQCLLRDSIVRNYNKAVDNGGTCPIYVKESCKKAYAAYHNLEGNDVVTELYRKILQMPEGDKHEHDK